MGPLVAPDGGGVELAQFFARILERAYKQGPITLQDAREAISLSHNNLFPRMRYLYRERPGDGVDACVHAVLDQLVQRKMLAVEAGGRWACGSAFRPDKPLRVLPLADGWLEVSVRSEALSEDELQRRLEMPDDELLRRAFVGEEKLGLPDEDLRAVHNRLQRYFSATARLLQPENSGLRPVSADEVSRKRIDVIKDSVRRYGLRPEFPILLDKKGRILSGRHRLAAATELLAEGIIEGPWPQTVLPLEKDEDAVLVAMAANASSPWTKRDFEYLRKVATPEESPREKTRRLIVLALLQDRAREGPKHSDASIARLVGCHPATVKAVREWLEETCQIDRFRAQGGGRGHTEALPVPPGSLTQEVVQQDEQTRVGPSETEVHPRRSTTRPAKNRDAVLGVLGDGAVHSVAHIATQAGLNTKTVSATCSQLVREGKANHVGPALFQVREEPALSVQTTAEPVSAAVSAPRSVDDGPHVGYAGELRTDEPDGPEWVLEADRPDHVICARGVMDGARTLSEAADLLERYAAYLRQKEREGWQLVQTVMDDRGPARRHTLSGEHGAARG